jgi:GH24 family phage-related lysozyme (muramidase)
MTATNPQRVSRDGYIELMQREAIVLVPYLDDNPNTEQLEWSQGMGCQTNYRKTPPRPVQEDDEPIDVATALAWLRRSVAEREDLLNKWLSVDVTRGQFDALHSLLYQRGTKAAREIIALFNADKPNLAMCRFAHFPNGASGVDTEGHAMRRLMEICIAFREDYGEQTKVKIYDERPVKGKANQFHVVDVSELPL